MNHSSTVNQIVDFLTIGGPVVWILMGFSIIAVTIGLLKIWQFSSLKIQNRKNVDQAITLWANAKPKEASSQLSEKQPVESVLAYVFSELERSPTNLELIREEAQRRALNALFSLRSFLRPLEIIASLAPLLGLLGTVLGMITAFQQMQGAGSQVDPSVLSGGIWQALLTTAVGIAVAIPVVALHAWLERKVERVAHIMNDVVTQAFTRCPKQVAKIQSLQEKELHAA